MEYPYITFLKAELSQKGRVTCTISVSPGARETALHDVLENNTLKIRISKPADKGKANKELIRFLGKFFHVPQVNIDIVKGEFSHLKVVQMKY
ncbi:MAG: DUF167 domain-containing protein [bacterium]|nr:DUF167 domain-containing protein [bacterium]